MIPSCLHLHQSIAMRNVYVEHLDYSKAESLPEQQKDDGQSPDCNRQTLVLDM